MIFDKFTQERNQALQEIRELTLRYVENLARSPIARQPTANIDMPAFALLREAFRWPAEVIAITTYLEQGKSPREVFARVARPQPSDIGPSSARGRDSAFKDVLKALDLALRDFDKVYQPLDRGLLDFWKKRHPIEEKYLEQAWKENLRLQMKNAIDAIKGEIEALRDRPPSPGNRALSPRR